MELSPSCETASCATTQKHSSILWNPKVHCHVHKSPPLVSILSQIDPVHTTPSNLRYIFILSTHLCLGLPSVLFPSGFPTNIPYMHFSPIRATCPTRLIFHNLIILIIFGEEYKLWSSSWCSSLQSPVTSSLFGPNTLLSTLFYIKIIKRKMKPLPRIPSWKAQCEINLSYVI
jgi:hypothetical protein